VVSSSPAPSILVAHRQTHRLLAILLVLLPVIVAATVITVPFSTPMGGFWSDAQQFARLGHISSVFTPCGYPALLGIALRGGGTAGVVIAQLLLYVVILLAIYQSLRLLAIDRTRAAMAAALLGFHPEVLINIKKIWDTNITTVFLLLLCASLLTMMRKGLSPLRTLLLGVLWGLSMNVRPNFPAMILPIVFALWFASGRAHRVRTLCLHSGLALAIAGVTLAAVNTAVHGSFFLPQNGPYNLYAGDNAFTARALLVNLNAEPSIYPSLVANGFGPNVDVYNPALRPYFVQHAFLFIRQQPALALKLMALKLVTLLRPDTKIYPLASLGGVVKGILALAIPFWLLSLLVFRSRPWEMEDWLFVMFAVAYVVPFLLTNSDPRFRIPLDILLLTHALSRVARVAPARYRPIA
jgi:4-amino-4-deoxy-L-arabinose transferase-like glycosyltransferase